MNLTNEQIESLTRFVLDILDEWPEISMIDGGDIQDVAERNKILIPQTVYAPCIKEGCNCSEFYNDADFKAGIICYRIADWLIGR